MRLLPAVLIMLSVSLFGLGASCGDKGDKDEGPSETPSAPAGRVVQDAPIDELDVLILESFPVQYNLRIVSGLPSGCAEFDKAEITSRSGNEIRVRVTNTLPDDPNVACTAIYGTKETTLTLGTDITAGETYSVRVNDKSVNFTAQ